MSERIFWCPTCGIVWADDDGPPLCRHMVIDGPPARRMEPLPPGHPFRDKPNDLPRHPSLR